MEDTLWTNTHCRRSDPPTSRAAAASVADAGSHCRLLMAGYSAALPGGLTDEDAARRCGVARNQDWRMRWLAVLQTQSSPLPRMEQR